MIGLSLMLLLIALLTTILSATNRCPLWVPVFIIVMVLLLDKWPR